MDEWIERKQYADEGKERKRFNSLTMDSDFQRDRARVIHSSAFRRLQTKTQVLGIGEHDFYRTRLTHSIEVAQIGFGLCEMFRELYASNDDYLKWIPSLCAIEAICLCHDIGHPPFGHGGEVALNYSMFEYGGFEGNGQTLRIATKLGEFSPGHGLDLTRRTLLGLIKYPAFFSELRRTDLTKREANPVNLDAWAPPKCILDDEREIFDWIVQPLKGKDLDRFTRFIRKEGANGKTLHKSFDTSIMEIADDISYAVHDMEDAIALQLIHKDDWIEFIETPLLDFPGNPIAEEIDIYRDKLFSGSNRQRKHAISKLISYFIGQVSIEENGDFIHPLLRMQAVMEDSSAKILSFFKELVLDKVILCPEVQTLEYKGQLLIGRLFNVLWENPKRLLPEATYRKFRDEDAPARVLCDYIAGMTDAYATKIYHKLFSPSMGSVFDKL